MSEHSVTVLRLDITPRSESEEIAARLQELLLSRGVIAANDRHGPGLEPRLQRRARGDGCG